MVKNKRLSLARRKAGGKLSPKKLKESERHLAILQERLKGSTFTEIGREFGISKQSAYKHVAREMMEARAECRETAEEILELDLQRLDELFLSVYDKAKDGDMLAHSRALRNIDLRQKLVGNVEVGAPINVNLGVGISISLTVAEMTKISDDPEFKRKYYQELQRKFGDRIPGLIEDGQVLGEQPKEVATSESNGTSSSPAGPAGKSSATTKRRRSGTSSAKAAGKPSTPGTARKRPGKKRAGSTPKKSSTKGSSRSATCAGKGSGKEVVTETKKKTGG